VSECKGPRIRHGGTTGGAAAITSFSSFSIASSPLLPLGSALLQPKANPFQVIDDGNVWKRPKVPYVERLRKGGLLGVHIGFLNSTLERQVGVEPDPEVPSFPVLLLSLLLSCSPTRLLSCSPMWYSGTFLADRLQVIEIMGQTIQMFREAGAVVTIVDDKLKEAGIWSMLNSPKINECAYSTQVSDWNHYFGTVPSGFLLPLQTPALFSFASLGDERALTYHQALRCLRARPSTASMTCWPPCRRTQRTRSR
jgi:hypothetical protein